MEIRNYQLKKENGHEDKFFLDNWNFFENHVVRMDWNGQHHNNSKGNGVFLINGCAVDINCYGYPKKIDAQIYNADSLDKINETKSLLEEKTGWKLEEA